MLTEKDQEALQEAVEKFVKGLDGFYDHHCSDPMLVALIMDKLGDEPTYYELGESSGEAIVGGIGRIGDEACFAVVKIFESVLEHRCQAGGNGNHMAQEFARQMVEAFGKKN